MIRRYCCDEIKRFGLSAHSVNGSNGSTIVVIGRFLFLYSLERFVVLVGALFAWFSVVLH